MADYRTIPAAELGKGSNIKVELCETEVDLYWKMAIEVLELIQENNAKGEKTVMIVPYGPLGPYARLVELINKHRVSLKNCWFINMDEYLTDEGEWIEESSKLSFHGFMNRTVYQKLDPALVMPENQRVFPDPHDLTRIPKLIEELGGVDICFGGIGINGHVAFNEAQDELTADEFANLPTRVLTISRETRVANAIGDLNGAIDAMPHQCVTIGMKEILSAKKIRLGVFRDWHRAVVRQAAYGEVTAHFPVSLLQRHKDAMILVNANAAKEAF